MNTQKGFAPILIILLGLILIGGGVYFYTQNNIKETTENSQDFVMGGIWGFEEVSKEPGINGVSSPVWEYTLSIDTEDDTKGTLYIDGYQTITRLNVTIKKLNDSANVILDSYGNGNQFEIYKKGDVLITVSPDFDRNMMSIDWYKMQPNLEESKKGAFFVRQEDASVNKKVTEYKKKETPVAPNIPKVTLSVSGNNLLVIKEGKTIQTLTLSEDALSVLSMENPYINEQRFIINQDVNFDGHTDVALLTGVGYGGVNIVYDYYIFNPITSKLEKSDALLQVSNPAIDISAKKITSSSRSGPQWYSQTFQWNGSTYVVSEAVAQ